MGNDRSKAWLLVLVGAILACNSSSSSTDYEQARREMREESRYDRWVLANEQRRRENKRKDAQIDALYYSRFEGTVQPDIGCDVCPDLCARVDLQPLAAPAFQAHYSEAVQTMYGQDNLKGALASREKLRLMCMLRIGGEPLIDALSELMEPGTSYQVRIEASLDGIIEKVLGERGYEVLREIASGDDDAARLAELILEHLENGVYDYSSDDSGSN